jgi:hypothetical protein
VGTSRVVYYSLDAKGRKRFEVRHPRNGEGKRLYETVGPAWTKGLSLPLGSVPPRLSRPP